jgi:LPS export ABC transporter protein LptC
MRRFLRFTTSFVLFFTLWFLWPRELDGYLMGRDGKAIVPDYAMANVRYVSVKDGHLEVETRATNATFNLATHTMDAKNVVALLYNADNQRTIVTGDFATFRNKERELLMRENVQSLSPDGFLMRAPEAHYHLAKRILVAKETVEGETFEGEMRVWGDRAEAPLDETKVRLIGNARSQFSERANGLTKVRGDFAVLNRTENKVTFEKNVKVEQAKTVATSETADIYYSGVDKAVRYMSMNTDVKITEEKGRHSRSQVAEFFGPTDSIVLTGFPAVYDGDDAVTGDKITVYRATGVVEGVATNAVGSQGAGAPPKKGPVPLSKEDEELIPE